MSMPTHAINSEVISKILGMQFSIISPQEILKGSVVEVTKRDTFMNNKPVIGGLFDPRMGVIDSDLICPTDGLNYEKTPGYFGHINLARPVFYIQFLKEIVKICKCVCYKCGKLLINKETYNHFRKLDAAARWVMVYDIASSVSRCGEDTDDGCGCLQPTKISKDGLATIYARWKQKNADDIIAVMTAEIVLKLFKRISDDDVNFMGFNALWSRPDWMICQVLMVPPPAVRPSVKHDDQQRSEDDLTHILVNIIKTNNTLRDKIQNNADARIIDDWTTVLQYYVATQIDNKIKGVAAVAQRSGRPLKAIKDRINGKAGRMRGNLMAKRVDFSGRSVITADPRLSIRELGVPMKIAMNLTRPVRVNDRNRAHLTTLVKNGPDVFPGAKILEKANGESIGLRTFNRDLAVLENGDIVHRHLMNGDIVIFNRQPTLHRMSMMAHIVRVMKIGDTLRMNVADTKPYNADFDGDEMNLHVPQNPEANVELHTLAAIPYQIVSPANNSSIIGIFQDSMLGCYQFTRENIRFDARKAMNLLMSAKTVDETKLYNLLNGHNATNNKNNKSASSAPTVSSFNLLSHIMPPMSLKYKTSQFDSDTDDINTSNNVLEIKNGEYIRGQMNKGVMGSKTKGILQRVCNDSGNYASADFIDNLQNIVTDYMKTESFSVGVRDLTLTEHASKRITGTIEETTKSAAELIDTVQMGLFENTSGRSMQDAFESQLKSILDKCRSESGRIGLDSLSNQRFINRFTTMVLAGSKGSHLNLTFMVACLGQQDIDGKRIPYGFDNRTLPHFNKYDDTGIARGFIENSYINGLSAIELFFHAMGGRIGLIDTAVKTAVTGYIQRRLVKGLEDLMVHYDMTVRTNKGRIVQFVCGDDNFDTVKVESQNLPLVNMSMEEIHAHYTTPKTSIGGKSKALNHILTPDALKRHKKQIPELKVYATKYIDMMIAMKGDIIRNVFKYSCDSLVHCPVAFANIIDNVRGQCGLTGGTTSTDITLLEAHVLVEHYYSTLTQLYYGSPNDLFKTLYFFFLSPKTLIIEKRFTRDSLVLLLEMVVLTYKRAIIAPGEMVGIIAGQSIGEVSTQMTLNTFHFAGVASKSNVTRGVPRLDEITTLTASPKNPSITVFLKPEDETNKDKALSAMSMMEHTSFGEVVSEVEICFDPNDDTTTILEDVDMIAKYKLFESLITECATTSAESVSLDTALDSADDDAELENTPAPKDTRSKWIIRIKMSRSEMLNRNITMDDIYFTMNTVYDNKFSCIYSDFNADELIFRVRMNTIVSTQNERSHSLDQLDQIYVLKEFQESLLKNIVLRGVTGIKSATIRTIKNTLVETDGGFEKKDIWVLDTIGSNMMSVLGLPFIDSNRTVSNDIMEVLNVLGIEAARQTIMNEAIEVIEFDNTYINYHHFSVMVDRMCHNAKLVSLFRHGINNDNIGPIAKASFEETPEMFLKAAKHGELDIMRGVSANVMCGQEGMYGTNAFQVILDMDEMSTLNQESDYKPVQAEESIESAFAKADLKYAVDNTCGKSHIEINNNISNLISKSMAQDDEDYDPGF
jgi:DNA-directed RNA polymerase II subunit RPB1